MDNETAEVDAVIMEEPESDVEAQLSEEELDEDSDPQYKIIVANIGSQIRASIYQSIASCSVHERCDGSCGGLDALFEPTIIGPHEVGLSMGSQPFARPMDERTTPFIIDMALEEFTYTALDPERGYIRLLSIKSAIFRDDAVDCTLEVFSLESAPEYTALSYSWGTDPPGQPILCNGKIFMSRPSLEGALKRYRSAVSKDGPHSIKGTSEYLWADAICIDQENIPEKSNQLLLMEKIYRRATMVFVDLGHISPDWYCGFDLMSRAAGLYGISNLEIALPSHDHQAWVAYWHIFGQPWFTREWVVQEITLARSATVMFGRFIWTWEELKDSFSVLRQGTALQSYLLNSGAAAQGIINFSKIENIRKNYMSNHFSEISEYSETDQRNSENIALSHLLKGSYNSLKLVDLTRDFLCSDPRDKIFALSALIDDVETSQLGNYSWTIEEVYTCFALHHIRQGNTFSILDHAGLHRRNLELTMPSWVPDWTAQGNVENSKRSIAVLRNVPFSASKDTEAEVYVLDESIGNLRLVIKGQILDTLHVVVHEAGEPDLDEDDSFLAWHSDIRALLDSSHQLCSSIYQDLDDAFARLMLIDDLYTGDNKIAWENSITNPSATYKLANERIMSDKDINSRDASARDEVETFRTQMFVACGSRSFALSHHGYISLVPMSAKEGDMICIFRGSTIPYILRRTLNGVGYLLVGDAYVHGIMYGEALAESSIDITIL